MDTIGPTIFLWTIFYPITALFLMMLMSFWRINRIAGRPAWLAVLPGINLSVLHDIVGQPRWWGVLWFLPIPLIRFFLLALLAFGFSAKFNKGVVYTIGLALLPFIFYPHLAFSEAEYYPDAE